MLDLHVASAYLAQLGRSCLKAVLTASLLIIFLGGALPSKLPVPIIVLLHSLFTWASP